MKGQLALFAFAAGSLARRKGRSLAVLLALTASVAVLAAALFVLGALRGEADAARDGGHDLVVQRLSAGRPALLSADVAASLRGVPGVRRAEARVWGPSFVPLLSGNVTVVGTRGEAPGPAARGECVLGDVLARAVGVRVGDTLKLDAASGAPFSCRVTGLVAPALSVLAADVVLVLDADARVLLGVPDALAVDVAVDLATPDEAAAVAREAAARVPGARVVDRRLVHRVHALAYGHRAGFVLGALLPVLLAALVLAADRLSGIGARERREIAIVKAAGWSTASVLAEKAWEAGLLALLGTGTGLVAAYVWAFPLGAPLVREALAGWGHVAARGPLVPAVGLGDLVSTLGLVVVPFVALSIVPAWRAASADPLEAMRRA